MVVDNCSSDDTVRLLRDRGHNIRIVENGSNIGFASAVNIGIISGVGQHVLILNPDVEFTESTNLARLIKKIDADTTIGLVAPRLLYRDGTVQESARSFPNPIVQIVRGLNLQLFKGNRMYRRYIEAGIDEIEDTVVEWVIGAFILARRETLEQAGYLDRRYFIYYEDADLCIRLRKKGLATLYTPSITAIHDYQRESSRRVISKLKIIHAISILRFYLKHGLYLLELRKDV